MKTDRKTSFDNAKRVIVKVGSNVLTEDSGLDLNVVRSISRQICRLIDRGLEVILVTSGAMSAGLRKIGLSKRPDEIPKRQAVSAVGQASLIMEYENAFERYGNKVAQILLTSDDLNNRKRYLNARNTLYTLLSWQVVPIINENDTVTIESIKFGDNDNLAAMIALLMDADILIILSDIDGLYAKDPRSNPDAELIPTVTTFKKSLEKVAGDNPGSLGTGGMLSKIKAAKKVTAAGVPMVIANGNVPDILEKLFDGEPFGTFFVPQAERLPSRKCWIGYSLKPEGVIVIDQGAATAVLKRGKSLLSSGIVGVEGDFGIGAPVEFKTAESDILGTGLVNYSATDIRKIMGLQSRQIQDRLGEKPYDEVIHRDNLVITTESGGIHEC
ncbi:MAG: glutamate 5-kinase [Deltaproteobacteria bacterium]|nr:glutamate 5-kinase [Deltaproteobacteria bacterium]